MEIWKKIWKKITEFFEKDKLLHMGANFIMALTAFWDTAFAVGLCIGASLGKEYGDSKASGNKWSWEDIVADLIGACLGLLVVYITKKAFNF